MGVIENLSEMEDHVNVTNTNKIEIKNMLIVL